jgi:hypothetical protein
MLNLDDIKLQLAEMGEELVDSDQDGDENDFEQEDEESSRSPTSYAQYYNNNITLGVLSTNYLVSQVGCIIDKGGQGCSRGIQTLALVTASGFTSAVCSRNKKWA